MEVHWRHGSFSSVDGIGDNTTDKLRYIVCILLAIVNFNMMACLELELYMWKQNYSIKIIGIDLFEWLAAQLVL